MWARLLVLLSIYIYYIWARFDYSRTTCGHDYRLLPRLRWLEYYSAPIFSFSIMWARLLLASDTGVCEKNTPPQKKTLGTIRLRNTTSGAGEEFLLLFCRAGSRKWICCSQTPVRAKNAKNDTCHMWPQRHTSETPIGMQEQGRYVSHRIRDVRRCYLSCFPNAMQALSRGESHLERRGAKATANLRRPWSVEACMPGRGGRGSARGCSLGQQADVAEPLAHAAGAPADAAEGRGRQGGLGLAASLDAGAEIRSASRAGCVVHACAHACMSCKQRTVESVR